MAASTNKKVVIVRFERGPLRGFIQTPGGLGNESAEVLSPDGTLVQIPYAEIKAVCFVRDLDAEEIWEPHRSFATRPKSAGLWVRLLFRDGDTLEGILPNNLLLIEPAGFGVVPPDPTFQNHRIFVPRSALSDIQVLGVVASPLRRRARKPADRTDQLEMFDESA